MSLDSPADVVPFERFLESRERRRRNAAEKSSVVVGQSTDLGLQPDVDRWARTVASTPLAAESRVARAVVPVDPATPRTSP